MPTVPLPYSVEHLRAIAGRPTSLNSEVLSTYVQSLRDWEEAVMLLNASADAKACPGGSIDARCADATGRPWMSAVTGAVCQILYTDTAGTQSRGTATFVRGPDLILTAGHVVPPAVAAGLPGAGRLVARFNFERQCDGPSEQPVDFPIALAEPVGVPLDYALLQAQPVDGRLPEAFFTPVPVGSSAELLADQELICIHHPLGAQKQLSTGRFLAFLDAFPSYDMFTDFQSSGAPLITDDGKLVAVHSRPSTNDPCVKLGAAIDDIVRQSSSL